MNDASRQSLPRTSRRHRGRGFTLLEVLVALTIVVLGMAAVWSGSSQATINASRLQKKTFANWIAMNRLAELRLERTWPQVGRSDGDVEFANAEWRWFANVTQTQIEDMRRVEIAVALAEKPDEQIINLVGFVTQPSNSVVAVTPWAGTAVNPGDTLPGENGGANPGQGGNNGAGIPPRNRPGNPGGNRGNRQ
ncbi:MAG: type II secretion system minor pseudopilin GspI [Pseudomonadota bacterium]